MTATYNWPSPKQIASEIRPIDPKGKQMERIMFPRMHFSGGELFSLGRVFTYVWYIPTFAARWFKVTFWSPIVGGHKKSLKRSRFHHPKKGTAWITWWLKFIVNVGKLYHSHGLLPGWFSSYGCRWGMLSGMAPLVELWPLKCGRYRVWGSLRSWQGWIVKWGPSFFLGGDH